MPPRSKRAVRCLAAGGLVAFPTETVYGLGADATDGRAVARLYAGQGPAGVQSADLARGRSCGGAEAGALQRRRGAACRDVLARTADAGAAQGPADCPVADLATAGLDSIAVRVPHHPVAQEILAAFGKPVVAPSANRSGHVSPTTAAHVLADLRGRIDLIVDGGATPVGVESTIVACLGEPVLLRPGGVPREAIERALGRPLARRLRHAASADDAPLAPGMLASHYAPRTPLRLDASDGRAPAKLCSRSDRSLPQAPNERARVLNLSQRGDLIEAAANLFSHLRALDGAGAKPSR